MKGSIKDQPSISLEDGFHAISEGAIDVRGIAAATIENAFSTSRADEIKTDPHMKQQRATHRREALTWFRQRGCADLPFTFEWCCEVCGFDPDILGAQLLAEIAKGRKKTYRYNSLRRPANKLRRRNC